LDRYDAAADAACAQNVERYEDTHNRYTVKLQVEIDGHARVSAEVSLMRTCYDLDVLDAEFEAYAVSDATGALHPKLSEILDYAGEASACSHSVSNSSLEDGTFNCEAIPDCDIPCDELADEQGTDHSDLADVSLGTSCTAEWWFHAYVLKAVFTLGIWAFLNLFRVLSVMGLCRLLWRQLNTGLFAFLGTSTIEGVATFKQEVLADKIHVMLSRIQVFGIVLLFCAVLLQVPWVLALITVAPKVAYDLLA